MKKRELGI